MSRGHGGARRRRHVHPGGGRAPPGKDDCGTRKTKSTPLSIQLDEQPEDADEDLAPLVESANSVIWAGPPLFAKAQFKTCRVLNAGVLGYKLPVKANATNLRALRRGRTRTFTMTKVSRPCTDTVQVGTTCSFDWSLTVRIKRVR